MGLANDELERNEAHGRATLDRAESMAQKKVNPLGVAGGKNDPNIEALNNAEQSGTANNNMGDDINSAENNPANVTQGPWDNKTTPQSVLPTKMSLLKKKGPMTAIVLTLVGGGIGIGGLLSPSLILIHLKETFAGLDNSTSALIIKTNKMMANKVKNSFAESSTGKCNLACKFGSMNDTMKRNFEAKGYTIEANKKTITGKYIVESMTFPDGVTKITTGAEFTEAIKDPGRASSFNKVFNSKAVYFLNSKFGQTLRLKFGLDKLPKLAGETKEKVTESLRKALGLEGSTAAEDPALRLTTPEERLAASKFKAVSEFINGKAKSLNTAVGAGGLICGAYGIAKGITYADKFAKIAAFAGFAMLFLNAADQIKAGDADPAVISQLGDQLTQTDANGKSAMDSLGYRMGAYGDTGSLSSEDQKYSITPAFGVVGILAKLTSYLTSGGSKALTTARVVCKVSNNLFVAVGTSCPEQITAIIAASVGSGGVGAIPAALLGAGWCAAKIIGQIKLFSIAISEVLSQVVPAIVKNDLPLLDENTIGEAAGDSIYSGTSQILGGKSAAYGLKAGNKAEIEQYAIDTASIQRQNDTIARYDARDTPFDITNQYSFLGSIAQTVNLGAIYNQSLLSSFKNIFSIIPKSLATIANNVGAVTNSRAALYSGQCNDDGLLSLGIDADAFCNPSYVMSSGELNSDINDVLKYMTDKAHTYINEDTGDAISGSDYQKYLDFCANRIGPLGETQSPIEEDDYDWKVGLRCVENSEMLSNFRSYTMDKAINDTMDEA